jgi:hypothetical protein
VTKLYVGNWVLRGIFGPKREEVTGEWRKLHNEELHDLYCSPTVVWVIKSRIMKWAGHVALKGRGEACTGVWGVSGLDGRIILRWIFKK